MLGLWNAYQTYQANQRERARQEAELSLTRSLAMWTDLYELSNKVAYFDPNEARPRSRLDSIRRRISAFVPQTDEVVNSWTREFPTLTDDDQAAFLVFINTVLESADSVAAGMRAAPTGREAAELKDGLRTIEAEIDGIAHPLIIQVLDASLQLRDLNDGEHLFGIGSKDSKSRLTEEVASSLLLLKSWATSLMKDQVRTLPILPTADGRRVDTFRQESERAQRWLRAHPYKVLGDYPNYGKVWNSLNEIPLGALVLGKQDDFSEAYIFHLARWLARESAIQDIQNRARWLRIPVNFGLQQVWVTDCRIDASTQTASADVHLQLSKHWNRVSLVGTLQGQTGSEIGSGELELSNVMPNKPITATIHYYFTGDPVPDSCFVEVVSAE
jgi:hypothetical protein